jgi:Tfp pilus assembly protein PilO
MNVHTPAAAKIIGSLTLLLIVVVGWLVVVGPETDELGAVRGQIVDAGDQNRLLAQELFTLKQQADDLDGTRATARALATKFPPTADQPGVFEQVTAAALAAGIGSKDITALTPTPPSIGAIDPLTGVQPVGEGDDSLARQMVTLSVEGDYTATQDLLANLEDLPRAFLIDSVTLTTGEATTEDPVTSFTTTITGDMFVMPPAPDPDDPPLAAVPEPPP